jgi:hypothetical protein
MQMPSGWVDPRPSPSLGDTVCTQSQAQLSDQFGHLGNEKPTVEWNMLVTECTHAYIVVGQLLASMTAGAAGHAQCPTRQDAHLPNLSQVVMPAATHACPALCAVHHGVHTSQHTCLKNALPYLTL